MMRFTKRRMLVVFVGVLVFVAAACQTSPLNNPTGTGQGLAPIGAAELVQARQMISQVPLASPGTMSGYDRKAYGPAWTDTQDATWGRNGCDTRNDVLNRDMESETYNTGDACVVLTGTLYNTYKGDTISFVRGTATSGAVQIDHVYALGYSYAMGAGNWSATKRREFANDPLNLLAVDGSSNASKGAKSPATWLPSNTSVDCAYSVRFAQVAIKYTLPVSSSDRAVMMFVCAS